MSYIIPVSTIDSSNFQQNAAGSEFWQKYLMFIRFCNDVALHKSERQELRRYMKSKDRAIKRDAERNFSRVDTDYYRARFLAAGTLWMLAEVAKTDAEIQLAERILTETDLTFSARSHETAHFERYAVSEFSF